uniref:Uncharacterized protein n=1 Tax=Timema tahoe TaxID=61484 RepID=A0A7R9IDB1_9NEOP|nr:unnamed protein product [Timema tahoe]
MDLLSRSVRVCDYYKVPVVKLCADNSSMSPETKRSIPPPTETIQTKPFPIRVRPALSYVQVLAPRSNSKIGAAPFCLHPQSRKSSSPVDCRLCEMLRRSGFTRRNSERVMDIVGGEDSLPVTHPAAWGEVPEPLLLCSFGLTRLSLIPFQTHCFTEEDLEAPESYFGTFRSSRNGYKLTTLDQDIFS